MTTRAVGYVRVSTTTQADSGAGLDDQRSRIQDEIRRRGWRLAQPIFEDVASGRTTNGRANLRAALKLLDAGDADCLVVKDISRLARSTVDFGRVLERAARHRWQVVVLDLGVDTTTATGRMVANVVASIAAWEAEMIGERTRDGLAVKRRQGVRIGRPRTLPDRVRRRIRRLHRRGDTPAVIARRLNEDHVPTAQGGRRWHASTVRKVLLTK